ncbi:MAG: proton-conducting membrane transporter, partial [Calditrichaeota bacterium]
MALIDMKNDSPPELNLEEVDQIIERCGRGSESVIAILQTIQQRFHYLPESALRHVCQVTDITPAAIAGVSTFYNQFRHQPVGSHFIQVCVGTACHVKGAELVYDAFLRELNIPKNEDTDPQRQFTVQKVACLGCCTLAPVVQIDQSTFGHVRPENVTSVVDEFLHKHKHATPATPELTVQGNLQGEIRVGLGSCCQASGSADVHAELRRTLVATGIDLQIKRVGCVGMCHRVPLIEVVKPNQNSVFYDRVDVQQVKGIVLQHFKPPSLMTRLKQTVHRWTEETFFEDQETGYTRHPLNVRDPQVAVFTDQQMHIATERAGVLDPLDLLEYQEGGGFQALQEILFNSSSAQVIDTIFASGLRGRGGAGFSTGEKWRLTRQATDEVKFIICNGDEGDPGAFMDRMILESYPFRVIEGMIIGAYAVGAHQGYLYIRAEYPLAVQRIRYALQECEKAGFLGEQIMGSAFSLHLKVMEGAGAFVCGEETALIASIEGRRGMPSFRPPYPAEKGLWGHSTLVNNCETFATVPWIVRNGAQAFRAVGTVQSAGTKVFSLAGKITRGGLIEVPMGITVREIVEKIGGGVRTGRQFKAVQIGGPSGGCVPAELSDTPIDFEELNRVGAMMGSGGLLVLDDRDCMVDIARYFLTFTCNQSCGKCTYCRIGTQHMLEILERLCTGMGQEGDIEKLEELAQKTRNGSLCGLGKTAPNPVLSTLKYFRHEYEAHLQGICPAGRCQTLIRYEINDACIGCTLCAQKCPVDAIPLLPFQKHEII